MKEILMAAGMALLLGTSCLHTPFSSIGKKTHQVPDVSRDRNLSHSILPERSVVHLFLCGKDGSREPRGTGFVVDSGGIVASAAHVVKGEGDIEVRFVDFDGGRPLSVFAEVILIDEGRDVVLLQVDASHVDRDLVAVHWTQATQHIGDRVAIYGFPESRVVGPEMRRSTGYISSRRRNPINRKDSTTRMWELEAKIEPGNSGSPVFDLDRRVIAMVSSRWDTVDSYALAVPSSVVRELLLAYPLERAKHADKLRERARMLVLGAQNRLKVLGKVRKHYAEDAVALHTLALFGESVRQARYCGEEAQKRLALGQMVGASQILREGEFLLHDKEADFSMFRSLLGVLKD